jgi:SAM-dependent methyltransferase
MRSGLSSRSPNVELFVVSLLLLFLELACIRWFPAHVLYLTFFTNTILLASFLGMSLGCLLAGHRRNFLTDTPALLLVAMIVAQVISVMRNDIEAVLRVGNQLSPQLVFFGTEYAASDPTRFVVPIEAVEGFFFLIVALVMVGPGQALGRALKQVPDRLQAYTLNILGSLVGILLFALCSWAELSPLWWFTPIVLVLGYLLLAARPGRPRAVRADILPALAVIPAVVFWTSGINLPGNKVGIESLWSPYYRVQYDAAGGRQIAVNLIGHQAMVARDDDTRPAYAYALPHLLQRDAGARPFEDVLVIGAGSGNDVSRALAFGARHVDAVEIDPAIQRLGARDHPDRPYEDPRVTVHIGDGRNYLRQTDHQYDLVVFALVDSLVLHSGYSNIRLESFMFTREAIADVRRHLRPGGVFVMYNLFRQGWIVDRLSQEVQETFGTTPVVMRLPFADTIGPETNGGFTILMAGAIGPIQQAFDQHGAYWLPAGRAPSAASPDGFAIQPDAARRDEWLQFGPAKLISPGEQRSATDDWPFLYLRQPMIPDLSLRGMAVMGGLALVLFIVVFRAGRVAGPFRLDGRMFFLGAGFMLVETRAVVNMALLFGSTWSVNSVVFAAVLSMILVANLYVWRVRPSSLTPYYGGLMIALALNVLIPLDVFLGWAPGARLLTACLLAFVPIFFSGIIFAVVFSSSRSPDQDFGANIAGAMFGGLAENSSMLLGFRYLTLVVIVLYALSAVFRRAPSVPDALPQRPTV